MERRIQIRGKTVIVKKNDILAFIAVTKVHSNSHLKHPLEHSNFLKKGS